MRQDGVHQRLDIIGRNEVPPLESGPGLSRSEQAQGSTATGPQADVGMRAVIAPMVADRSFYEAIPGLMEALPRPLQDRVAELRLPPAEATLAAIREALRGWSFDRDRVRPAVAPTIPHHCSDAFILGCADLARDFGHNSVRLILHGSTIALNTLLEGRGARVGLMRPPYRPDPGPHAHRPQRLLRVGWR